MYHHYIRCSSTEREFESVCLPPTDFRSEYDIRFQEYLSQNTSNSYRRKTRQGNHPPIYASPQTPWYDSKQTSDVMFTPHVNSGMLHNHWVSRFHFFSLKLIKRKFHPSGRGLCLGCRSYLAGPTRRGRWWQEVLHGHPEVVKPPLVGLNKNPRVFFASHFVFWGSFTLNDSFMEKCVGWIPEKSARQNRTDLEKSCSLKSFFWTLGLEVEYTRKRRMIFIPNLACGIVINKPLFWGKPVCLFSW